MITLRINGKTVTLYDDEAIVLASRVKDLRDIGKVFDDFSYEFSVPADNINNDIFQHISNGAVIPPQFDQDGYVDFRFKQKAEILVDEVDYKLGYIKYIKATKKDGKLSQHVLRYTGGIIDLSDKLGNVQISDLTTQLSHLDHYSSNENIALGMNNETALFDNKIIYPLVSAGKFEVTAERLRMASTLNTDGVWAPAIEVKELLKAIGSYADTDIDVVSSYKGLDYLYLWGSRETNIPPDEEAETYYGILKYDSVTGGRASLVDAKTGKFTYYGLSGRSSFDRVAYEITVTPSDQAVPYRVELLQSGNVKNMGENIAENGSRSSGELTGTQTFTLAFDADDGPVDEVFWGNAMYTRMIADQEIEADITMVVSFRTHPARAMSEVFTGNIYNFTVTQKAKRLTTRLPEITCLDFFKGILQVHNLIPVADISGETPVITLYDFTSWKEEFGSTVDISEWVDTKKVVVTVPDSPKSISIKHQEPKNDPGIIVKNIDGYYYGDFIQSDLSGEGEPFEIETPFVNMVWDRLLDGDGTAGNDITNYYVGKSVIASGDDTDLKGVYDDLYLMYWDPAGAYGEIRMTSQSFDTYKICNSYNADFSETLNFSASVDQYSTGGPFLNIPTVNNYDKYYSPYLETLLNPTSRYYEIDTYIPAAIITQIHLASTLIINDEGYSINSITTNTETGDTKLELVSRYDSPIIPPYKADTTAPVIGVLRVDRNPIPTTPYDLIPSEVSGDSFRLDWSASISEATIIEFYHIYKNDVYYSTVAGTSTFKVLTGLDLGSYNKWTVEAEDSEGQLSYMSDPLFVQQFNSDGTIGQDAYTIVIGNEAHTLPTTNAGVVTYTDSGTTIDIYRGDVRLTGVSLVPIAGEYRITTLGQNIIPGPITPGQPSIIGDHSSMTANEAQVTITIELEGLITVDKYQSLAKSVQGDNGADGTGVRIVGSVATSGDLDPAYTGDIGDMFIAQDTGDGWVWDGATWDNVGQIQGPAGPQGDQGTPGQNGTDGSPTYFHVAYADDVNGNGFSQAPLGKDYMGTYVDSIPGDSSDPNDYTWVLIKGIDGTNGIPGENGENGETSYLHIAYANSADGVVDFSTFNPDGRDYLGQYTDFTLADSNDPADYTWSLIKGAPGADGTDGVDGLNGSDGLPGVPGADGQTSYFHTAYADDASGGGFSQDPTGKTYIGTYVDFNPADSSNPNDYTWALIKGADGEDGTDGIPGTNGSNGETSYLHLAYSNSVDGNLDFSTSDPTGRAYLGQYVDFIQADSNDPADYLWGRIKGEQGVQGIPGSDGADGLDGPQGIPGTPGTDGTDGSDGTNGDTTYFHVAYADDASGGGFSQDPAGKAYMGTYSDFTPGDSSDPNDYNWSLIKGTDGIDGTNGQDGAQGIPGENGIDGITYYLHIAYANNSTGTVGFSTTDSVNKLYIGQSVDTDIDDPTDPSVYLWSKIKGEQGDQGIQGEKGIDGIDGTPGTDGTDGVDGTAGQSTALIFVYKRSATQPANPTGGSFNFTTTTITPPVGWSVGVPSGSDPVWITRSIASIIGQTGEDTNISWSTPEKAFEDGAEGAPGQDGADGSNGSDGTDGAAGYSYYEGIIFRRSASAPGTPTGGSFDFGNNILTPPSGWSIAVPAGSDPVYSTNGTFNIQGSTGVDTSVVWKTPEILAENGSDGSDGQDGAPGTPGADGTDGLTGNSVYQYPIYRRSSSSIPTPTGGSYNFTTNTGSPPSGWSNTVPTGTIPLYTSTTVASVNGPTGTDSSLSWSSPVILAENGEDGQDGAPGEDGQDGAPGTPGQDGTDGTDGRQTATGYVYYQTPTDTSPGNPTATSYNFSGFAFTGLTSGWSRNPITATGGGKYWAATYTVTETVPEGGVGVPNFSAATVSLSFTEIVTFTDLSTSGSTVINGDNITTGNIQSANYSAGVSGTRIDLTNGAITSKNFAIDSSGNASFNGSIVGGDINIGSGNFTVASDGFMYLDRVMTIGNTGGALTSNATSSQAGWDITNQLFNLGAQVHDINGSNDIAPVSLFFGNSSRGIYGYQQTNGGSSKGIIMKSDGFLDIRPGGTTDKYTIIRSDLRVTGNITGYYSDDRLKNKLGNIDAPLTRIGNLTGFRYIENDVAKSYGFDNDKVQVGISAQEVQGVLPEAVSKAPFDTADDGSSISGEDYLTVDYSKIVPLLVEGINELNTRVEYLLSRIEELENK